MYLLYNDLLNLSLYFYYGYAWLYIYICIYAASCSLKLITENILKMFAKFPVGNSLRIRYTTHKMYCRKLDYYKALPHKHTSSTRRWNTRRNCVSACEKTFDIVLNIAFL